jgi:hypothetical protein
MKFNTLFKSTIIVLLAFAGSLQAAEKELPEVTVDGLRHVKDSDLAIVYADPEADFSQYTKIHLADAYVAFKKNWKRDQNRGGRIRVTSSDMEDIKTELAALFREVFTETLTEGGYELSDERGDDVLIIKPAIINLDVQAPDTRSTSMSRSRTYSESAGEMTLYLELYDSVTDDLLGKALDRQIDRETGYFEWQNSITNRAAATRILKEWANVLKEGLDAARSAGAD